MRLRRTKEKVRMNKSVVEVIYRLNTGKHVEADLLTEAFDAILHFTNGELRRFGDVQLGIILSGLMAQGPTADQVEALLRPSFNIDRFKPLSHHIPLPQGKRLVAAIGSGKKGHKTINISTPSCIVASSLGAFIAKPVWGSTSSLTGSADLLYGLGAKIDIGLPAMSKVVQKVGFGAFSIVKSIPNFERVYRGKFFAPTPLSFGLAALSCSVKYDSILYGISHPNVKLSLEVLRRFGITDAMVVSSTDDDLHYMDEVGIYGKSRMIGVQNGKMGNLHELDPFKELRLSHRYTNIDIGEKNSAEENIQCVVDILSGHGEAAMEDIVCLNASVLLGLAGLVPRENVRKGYLLSKQAIRRSLPLKKLVEFIKATGGSERSLDRYAH
jgi:anthranilate phosphoribosyltransferase